MAFQIRAEVRGLAKDGREDRNQAGGKGSMTDLVGRIITGLTEISPFQPSHPLVRRIEDVDLLRCCAVEARFYSSRYGARNGAWEYLGPIVINLSTRQNAYRNKERFYIASGALQEEQCALCGAVGTVIKCDVCHLVMCPGRTTADGYFRCHRDCPGKGYTKNEIFVNHGVAL